MRTTHRTFRQKVQSTQLYQSLNSVQKEITGTKQNLSAIACSLQVAEQNGIKHWVEVSQNSLNNSEIIRELYAKNLIVQF